MSEQYPGRVIVGFPTKPGIVEAMGDCVTTASEAGVEAQYAWIRLLEKYWLGGTGRNNQISYTLKYDPAQYSLDDFRRMLLEHQPAARVCSLPPTDPGQLLPVSAGRAHQ